eukprot:COSAG06_NODE_10638_length_1644_cov_1.295793_3_plen_99_part_00
MYICSNLDRFASAGIVSIGLTLESEKAYSLSKRVYFLTDSSLWAYFTHTHTHKSKRTAHPRRTANASHRRPASRPEATQHTSKQASKQASKHANKQTL